MIILRSAYGNQTISGLFNYCRRCDSCIEIHYRNNQLYFKRFFLGLGAILVVGGAVILALKFFKENRDDADDEPFRGIKQ